ncbi:MAG: DUF4860 domain-containing protein [Butyrivibrio sp.]|nr:DUF4860 domain-containing protein [Butyrivibrio sp.]
MNNDLKQNHMIDSIFVICLMLLFLISALSVIAIGAGIYKKNVSGMSHNYERRTACAYITEKVRQNDNNGAVFVRNLFDENVLVLQEELNEDLYNTYIYYYDGHLMELYARADLDNFYPQSGQKILDISSFDIEEKEPDLLSASITLTDGKTENIYIAKRSRKAD